MAEMFLILAREFNARVRTRAFILGTLLTPIFLIASVVIPQLGGGGTTRHFALVNEASPAIADAFVQTLQATPRTDRDNVYQLTRRSGSWQEQRAQLDKEVLEERIDGYVVIPADILNTSQIHYRARSLASTAVMRDLQTAASRAVQSNRIRAAGLDEQTLTALMQRVSIEGARLTSRGEEQGSAIAAFFSAYAVAFLIYMLIVIYGVNIMRSVLEEKTNRIAEVILSSVPAGKLLAGKLFGVGGAAMFQVSIWVAMVALTLGSGAFVARLGLPPDALVSIQFDPAHALLLLTYFALGFFFYASFYAAIGSAVTSEQEGQSVQALAMLPIIVPLMFIVRITNDPAGSLATTLSIVPLTSPIAMPVRLAAAAVPSIELFASMALLALSLVAMTWAAGKIYRIGILSTGKKPSIAEVWRWMRQPG
jgi:ABC-2 type transport system permease protein